MSLTTSQVEALVAAILSVNGYQVEKVWGQLPGLRSGRLTDPKWVAAADFGDVIACLTASGHERGMLAGMMAERLQNLMKAVVEGNLHGLSGAF